MIPKPSLNTNPGLVGTPEQIGYLPQALNRTQPGEHGDRVLIADNDREALRQIVGIVEGLGFEAIAAPDGREAQRVLLSAIGFVAGIFELLLPHVSGPDLARHMMRDADLKTIPVIIMTRTNSTTMCTEAFSAGAMALLPKPFKVSQLQALLMTVVGKRRAAAVQAKSLPQAFGLRLIN